MGKVKKLAGEKPKLFMWCFGIAFAVSTALCIGGFFVPPKGEISGSVLQACGILMGGSDIFAIVYMLPQIISSGKGARFQHGNTIVTIGELEQEAKEIMGDEGE